MPVNADYLETIRRHRERRPESWGRLELAGDPAADLAALGRALHSYRNVLLDGLTFYVVYLLTVFDEDLKEFYERALALIREMARSEAEVLVVDMPLPASLKDDERAALRALHTHVARHARQVSFVEGGRVTPLGKSAAVRLDRGTAAHAGDPRVLQMRHG